MPSRCFQHTPEAEAQQHEMMGARGRRIGCATWAGTKKRRPAIIWR